MFKRSINLNPHPKETFFLWGPRQSGKSTLLKSLYPNAHYIDLLKTDEAVKYIQNPALLREELIAKNNIKLVIIDEIQKVPKLLDEVHWLIENKGIVFGLCGSSARKVKRGHANLLGGRAIRHELFGLTSNEIGKNFDLNHMLNAGYLPRHYLSQNPRRLLHSYVNDYLKEEIADEGLVRNLPAFSDFLHAASLTDTEVIQYSNIARECQVSMPTVKEYFQILSDTLLARFLPSYKKRLKRRVIHAPKFYFADVGIVNYLAKRGDLEQGSELFGKAFENWVFHELNAYNNYSEKFADLSYLRLTTGTEVDFIVNDFECSIEVKSSKKINDNHLKGLRDVAKDNKIKKRIMVCMESQERITEDGVHIMPALEFASRLWKGKIF